MKILVDAGVGAAVEDALRNLGYDVVAVRELDPRMDDLQVLAMAAEQDRLVVTMDKDFGEMVVRKGTRHAGVLLLRLEDAAGREKADIVCTVFRAHGAALQGRFSVYRGGRLRVRPGGAAGQGGSPGAGA